MVVDLQYSAIIRDGGNMKKCLNANYHCHNCDASFKVPTISDFAYGEFILSSVSGEYRYLNAFADSTYQQVIDIIARQPIEKHIDVQSIFGALACDYDASGQPFTIGNYQCSKCMSNKFEILAILPRDFIYVAPVTHIEWNKLEYEQKEAAYLLLV